MHDWIRPKYIRELNAELTPKLEGRGDKALVSVQTIAKVVVLLSIIADDMEKRGK